MIFGTNLKIYNAKNDLVDLDDLDSIFSVSPEGFGAAIENNIFNAGASFKSSGVDMKASSLKLNLYFGLGDDNSEMVEYRKFVEFLNYPPYRLVYITEGTELFRDCILNEITKSDINTNQVLLEQVIFDFLTPFYREISETYKPNSDTEGDGKIYAGDSRPRNLIANPNFLNNMESWDNMSDPEGTYQLQVPSSDKPNSNILKLTSSNNKLSSFINAWGLRVKKGDRLSFRVDIKTDNNPDYDRPVIRLSYGTGEKNYKYSDFGVTASTLGLKTATISLVVPEDGVFSLQLINQNWSTLATMSAYFREPMLIRGDVSDMPSDFYSGKPSNNYYVYPFVYESDYNGKSGVFQIENNSVYIGSAKGSPVEITVHGPCTNPYWEILDESKVLQSDGYNVDVPDGYKLVVSSIVQNQRMKLIAPDGTISDVYQQQDLSRSNLIAIPEGHVTLAFHNVGDVSFVYREEYITV